MATNNILANFLSSRSLNASDYLYANFSTTGNIATFPINAILPFDNIISGNIPLNNGIITLTANKKYKIEANLAVTSSTGDGMGTTGFAWVDSVTNNILNGFNICYNTGGTFSINIQNAIVSGIYIPNTNQTIKLVIKSQGTAGNQVIIKGNSNINIIQII